MLFLFFSLIVILLSLRDATWFDLHIVIASNDPLEKAVFISDFKFLFGNVYF